jgi:hypothetical protein
MESQPQKFIRTETQHVPPIKIMLEYTALIQLLIERAWLLMVWIG